jgi:hypothetical protein
MNKRTPEEERIYHRDRMRRYRATHPRMKLSRVWVQESPEQKQRRAELMVIKRAKFRQEGRCWECGKPSFGRVYCLTCAARRNAKKTQQFQQLTARTKAYQYEAFHQTDRRWNGHPAQVLHWALTQHRVCAEVEA